MRAGLVRNRLSRLPGRGVGTVFHRLILSYLVVVVAVTLVMGGSSYIFFQGKYDRELESVHAYSVREAAREIESKLVETAAGIYMECATQILRSSTDFLGESETAEGNSYKIYTTYQYLSGLGGRYRDRVSGIHIYYRAADIVVSSASGLRFGPGGAVAEAQGWRELLSERGLRQTWVVGDGGPVAPAGSGPVLRIIRCFPILSGPSDCAIVIAVDFPVSVLRAAIAGPTAPGDGASFLADSAGRILISSRDLGSADASSKIASEAFDRATSGGADYFRTIGGTTQLVSSVRLSSQDLSLVNVTPSATLYSLRESILLVLVAVAFGTILGGLALALILGGRIYSPLSRLIGRVKAKLDAVPGDRHFDEYVILDRAIENLSSRVDALGATLEMSRPMMKHELVSRLLGGDPPGAGELSELMGLLGTPPADGPYAGALFFLNPLSAEAFGSGEASRLRKYRLAEALEAGGGGTIIAATLAGESVGVIVSLRGARIEGFALSWSSVSEGLLGTPATICVGDSVGSLSELESSFDQARRLSSYRFFFPELRVFAANPDILAREGRSEALPRGLLESLAESLRLRDFRGVEASLAEVSAFARSDHSSAERCREELARVLRLVAEAGAEEFPREAASIRVRIVGLLSSSPSLPDLVASLSSEVSLLFAAAAEHADERSAILVGEVKRLIRGHLGENLSLDRVSEEVGISSNYLSKIFKEETGHNFVAFVTAERVAQAERLLAEGRSSVQDVGRAVGFNSPAYFIRQFKARYGATPYEYRRGRGGAKANSS